MRTLDPMDSSNKDIIKNSQISLSSSLSSYCCYSFPTKGPQPSYHFRNMPVLDSSQLTSISRIFKWLFFSYHSEPLLLINSPLRFKKTLEISFIYHFLFPQQQTFKEFLFTFEFYHLWEKKWNWIRFYAERGRMDFKFSLIFTDEIQ